MLQHSVASVYSQVTGLTEVCVVFKFALAEFSYLKKYCGRRHSVQRAWLRTQPTHVVSPSWLSTSRAPHSSDAASTELHSSRVFACGAGAACQTGGFLDSKQLCSDLPNQCSSYNVLQTLTHSTQLVQDSICQCSHVRLSSQDVKCPLQGRST